MTAHVRLEGITAGMRQTLSGTAHPFARVLLLPVLDVGVVNVLNQFIHIALVPSWATIPVAFRHLLLKVFFFKTRIDRGARNVA